MLQIIIKAIFFIIAKIYDLVLSPFFSVIFALFPTVATYFSYITTFLNSAFTYFATCLDLLCIPRTALLLLFDYYAIKYSIYLIRISLKFSIKVYNMLKP